MWHASGTPSSRISRPPEGVSVRKSSFGSVRRVPSGRYQARVTVEGRKLSLGTYATRRDAVAAIANASQVVTQPSAPTITCGEWLHQWRHTRVGHRLATQQRDGNAINRHVVPTFGHVALTDITPIDVQRWVNELATVMAPSTVQRNFTVFAQALGAAVDAGLLAANPATRIRRPRPRRYEARFLTPVELERLADATKAPWRVMVLVMA